MTGGELGFGRVRSAPVSMAYQLHNLRAFLVAANAGSIAGGAKQLFKTPSAVSRCVIEFEKALGVRVFDHNPRGIVLNGYGHIVLTRARRIEAELAQAAADLARHKSRSGSPSASAISHLVFNGRKLHLLIRLADTRKVSAAAAQLDLTQSGVSMALARIETSLGFSLFQRGKQGVIATDAADRLVLRAKRVFAEFRHMASDLAAESGELQGSVAIGTPPLGRTYVVPTAIAKVLSQHPGIQVTLMETSFEPLLVGLRSGDLDAIVGAPRGESDFQGLTIEPLFTDRLTVFARAGHRLSGRKLTLADLQAERWILPWSNSPSRTLFDACFRAEDMEPPAPSVESADLAVIRQLLVTGDMLAVASARQFTFEIESGLFEELSVPLTGMAREVGLISREGALLSPSARALLDAIRSQVERTPGQ